MLILLCSVSLSAQTLNPDPLDRLLLSAIEKGDTAGAVLLVGRGETTLYHKAFGHRQLEPQTLAMENDTVFDLASLTKPMATATAVMWLVQEGKLSLDERVANYLPTVDPRLTVSHLLLHRGGLVPDNPISDFEGAKPEIWERILASSPTTEPGSEFLYSDVGYLMLGKLVEVVDGRPLDQLCREEFWSPLKMESTGFGSRAQSLASTYERQPGTVHDPRAFALGGVAGHAGLFSNASDIAGYLKMMLGVEPGPLTQGMRQLMFEPHHGRAYGFDVDTSFSTARGQRFSKHTSLGHTGFTGGSLWFDHEHDIYVILLTNRLHPDNKGSVISLRHAVASNVANQLLGPPVQTGIDRLQADRYATLAGHKVGLLTNHTGLDSQGRRTVDLLHEASEVDLVRLFSPEHGLSGKHDSKVGDSIDETTGLTVNSLYGESRRPDPKTLLGLDVLVFDIQDAGCRFYTFISSMLYSMQAAKEAGVKFVVLDRPNPLGGQLVDGWLASQEQLDFIACWPIPLVHGMTVGELARLFNREVKCELEVIPMAGWRREMTWDQTGLTWKAPSPNLRTLTQAQLYPAIGLFEWGNISVGRGTDAPFELFGAPWIEDQRQLAWDLNQLELPGVSFVPIRFTPRASVHAGKECGGVQVLLTNRATFQPALAGTAITNYLNAHFRDSFRLQKMRRHLANDSILQALSAGRRPDWSGDLAGFKKLREQVLLY